MELGILVIGHERNKHQLPSGFNFVKRSSIDNLNIRGVHRFKTSSLVWSEYSAWFENVKIFEGKKITGVLHYRCILDLNGYRINVLPFQLRHVLLQQFKANISRLENFVIVGLPMNTPRGMWQQYQDSHPDSIEALEFACIEYDKIAGYNEGTTLGRVRNNSQFVVRNIFISDTNCALEWSSISLHIAKNLDLTFKEAFKDRWGGFVLERIFSIFIEDFVKSRKVNLIHAQHLYFVSLRTWIGRTIWLFLRQTAKIKLANFYSKTKKQIRR
jgi:hypothetical protein